MAVKQPTKLTPQEVESLNNLQRQTQQATFQFGQLSIEKFRLEETEDNMKKQLIAVRQEEIKLAKTLTDKYGKGTVNPETGEFTPAE